MNQTNLSKEQTLQFLIELNREKIVLIEEHPFDVRWLKDSQTYNITFDGDQFYVQNSKRRHYTLYFSLKERHSDIKFYSFNFSFKK